MATHNHGRDALANHLMSARRSLDNSVILAISMHDEPMAALLTCIQCDLTDCIECVHGLRPYSRSAWSQVLLQVEHVPTRDTGGLPGA